MPPERKRDYDWHRHYFTGRLGLLVTMHDEPEQVSETVGRMKPRLTRVLICKSGQDPLPNDLLKHVDGHELFPDLAGEEYSRWELPARSLARNYSWLFQMASGLEDVDWWIAITGDTVLLHEYGIERAIADASGNSCILACCRALKQDFHAADLTLEDLEAGKGGGRVQTADLADFMPQLFMVEEKAVRDGCLGRIEVTNRWCSEQTLGDAFMRYGGDDWRSKRHVYSCAAGEYQDGVVYHAKYR